MYYPTAILCVCVCVLSNCCQHSVDQGPELSRQRNSIRLTTWVAKIMPVNVGVAAVGIKSVGKVYGAKKFRYSF